MANRAIDIEEEGPVIPSDTDADSASPAAAAFPLSFNQEEWWGAIQSNQASLHLNEIVGLRLLGGLDLDVLSRALTWVESHHEYLRCELATDQGGPAQRISASPTVSLGHEDRPSLGAEQRDEYVQQTLQREMLTAFDATGR